ncbi:MAG: hypothetical protein RL236_1982 [Pseudomonadota bacterium]|jgi:hypothetical protein
MSLKSILIKIAIKLTPTIFIIWVSNLILKGIARLLEFEFDLENRKFHVKTQLYGEIDTIDVWVEDFMINTDGTSYELLILKANSDRLWLTNILALIVGKSWKIPVIPELAPHMTLIAELLNAPVHVKKDNSEPQLIVIDKE